MIVHTKQFLSLFSCFREIICLFALLQSRVKESEKKLLQLNWSCWSALTSLRTCFVAGALSLSVSLCQYQITQRGAVLWQRKMNWIIFVLSVVTNSNLSSFYSPVDLFLPDKMWLQWPRGYQFFHAICGGCRCEWVFRLQWPVRVSVGLQWPPEVVTLWRQFVEAYGLTAWGFNGLSSFFWAAVASRDSLACSKHGLFI